MTIEFPVAISFDAVGLGGRGAAGCSILSTIIVIRLLEVVQLMQTHLELPNTKPKAAPFQYWSVHSWRLAEDFCQAERRHSRSLALRS